MTMRPGRLLICSLVFVSAAGCSTLGPRTRPFTPDGEKCLALYERVDRQIAAAGVTHAGYSKVPGFPYLRSDRYSASFAHELPDMETFWEWVGYLRANDDEARDTELSNLKMSSEAAASLLLDLRGCGGWLRSWELDDAAFREHLVEVVAPPDDYSTAARAFGLYPLAKPFLRSGVARFQREVQADFDKPLAQLDNAGELVLWQARRADPANIAFATLDLRKKPRDRLGRIGMLWSEIVQLAHYHAPAFWIETVADYDRPGVPTLGAERPGVDVSRPVVYFLPGLTRFGGRSLLQISYFVWFSERAPTRPGDPAAGTLDGLIWRVTLDDEGRVLMHDSIHACGCDHFGFPVRGLEPRQDFDAADQAFLLPQPGAPTERIAVRLHSGTHRVRRVVALDQAVAARQLGYELRPYEELSNLPDPDGGTRSLFGPDGIIAGTERSERLWLWPSGVRNVGAMRQWGRHATSFVRREHFDDPFLLERVFVAPTRSSSR